MVSRDEFFREVTVRICSSLEITPALRSAFGYLKEFFPLDMLSLGIRDASLAAIRRVAHVTTDSTEPHDEIIPVPEQLWTALQGWKIRSPVMVDSAQDGLVRALATYLKLDDNSGIILPLWSGEGMLGWLTLYAWGGGRFTDEHVDLLATVADPFVIALANALAHERLLRYRDNLIDDNRFLIKELFIQGRGEIVGANQGLRHVMEMIRQVAPLNNTVLLLGETGTGKELIVNAIHSASPRRDGPLIKVNCGAIPEQLIDSELFGHEKGAFTGAVSERRGRFERADGGTIFLDEIGELPLQAQVRLLRVLQNHEIERVGGNRPIPVDIRVIAATHRNLEGMIAENRFREDLWFRLNVFPLFIPPLRQRREDVPALTRHFITQKCRELDIAAMPGIAPGALVRLMEYSWPGNVRELENLVERELILHRGGPLQFDVLMQAVRGGVAPVRMEMPEEEACLELDRIVSRHLRRVLDMTGGRVHGRGGAAELLGIKPSTLRWRLDRLGIPHGRGVGRGGMPPGSVSPR
jgi:transcriptional regulator with GAF, ATPase, and Fis domain